MAVYLQANVDKLNACLKAATPRECAGKHLYSTQGLAQGMYSVFLPEWLDYFNQEEMLVSLLESRAFDVLYWLHVGGRPRREGVSNCKSASSY